MQLTGSLRTPLEAVGSNESFQWGNTVIRFIAKNEHFGYNVKNGLEGGRTLKDTSSNTMEESSKQKMMSMC